MIVLDSVHDPRLIQLLKEGKVGVIPTDTIYGLACLADNETAVARLYELKHREGRPGTFIAANVNQLASLGLDEQALRSVDYLWPNPISIVVPIAKPSGYLDLGKDSLAVRIPKNDALLALLEQTGPLATSSVNLFGQPPANIIREAQAYFGENVDFYVDAGDLSGHKPSTIASFLHGKLEILRQGAVTID